MSIFSFSQTGIWILANYSSIMSAGFETCAVSYLGSHVKWLDLLKKKKAVFQILAKGHVFILWTLGPKSPNKAGWQSAMPPQLIIMYT